MDILLKRLKQYNRRLEKKGKQTIELNEYKELYYNKNRNYLGNENKNAGLKGESLNRLISSIKPPKGYELNGEPLTNELWEKHGQKIVKEFTKNIILRNKIRDKYNKAHNINKTYETYFNNDGTWTDTFKKASNATKIQYMINTLNREEQRKLKGISRMKWAQLNERQGLSAFTESLKQIKSHLKDIELDQDSTKVVNFFTNLTHDKIKNLYDKMENDPAAKNILNGILNNYHLGIDPTPQLIGNIDIFKRLIN